MTHILLFYPVFSWYPSPPETGITPFSVLLVDPTGFYLILYTCPPCIPEMGVVHLLFTVFTFHVLHTIALMSYHLVDVIGNRRIGLDPPGIDAGRRPTSLLHCTFTRLSKDVFFWGGGMIGLFLAIDYQ